MLPAVMHFLQADPAAHMLQHILHLPEEQHSALFGLQRQLKQQPPLSVLVLVLSTGCYHCCPILPLMQILTL
jgi:hypothetical protein